MNDNQAKGPKAEIDAYLNVCEPRDPDWVGGMLGDGTFREVHSHLDRDGVIRDYWGGICWSKMRVPKMTWENPK